MTYLETESEIAYQDRKDKGSSTANPKKAQIGDPDKSLSSNSGENAAENNLQPDSNHCYHPGLPKLLSARIEKPIDLKKRVILKSEICEYRKQPIQRKGE